MTVSSNIIIGERVNPPVLFDKFELWIEFDTGECETEVMFRGQGLARLNEWERVMPLMGPEAIEAIQVGFVWPCYDHGVPVPVVNLTMFYYDVHGVKHHTKLEA